MGMFCEGRQDLCVDSEDARRWSRSGRRHQIRFGIVGARPDCGGEEIGDSSVKTLVGMEWEPQLTLLKYPRKRVNVFLKGEWYYCPEYHQDKCCVHTDEDEGEVSIIVPDNSWWTSVTDDDCANIEIRTAPVTIKRFPAEVKRADRRLEEVVCRIAKFCGPTGVFLPTRRGLSKHLNLSPANKLKPKRILKPVFLPGDVHEYRTRPSVSDAISRGSKDGIIRKRAKRSLRQPSPDILGPSRTLPSRSSSRRGR